MGPSGSLKKELKEHKDKLEDLETRLARVEAIQERREAYRRIRVEKCPDLMLPQICNRPSKTNSNVKLTKLNTKKRRKTFQEEKGLHRPERDAGLWQTGSTTPQLLELSIYDVRRPHRFTVFHPAVTMAERRDKGVVKKQLKDHRTNLRTLKTDSVGSRQSRNGKPYKNAYSRKQFGKRSTGHFIYVLGKMGGEDASLQVCPDRAPPNARANKREKTLESKKDLSFEKTMHLYKKWGKQALNTGDEGIIMNPKVETNWANVCQKTLGSYLNRGWAKDAQALRANRQSGLSSSRGCSGGSG